MTTDAGLIDDIARELIVRHWDGTGCGTTGTSACVNCFGPSPMDAYEVTRFVLEAARVRSAVSEPPVCTRCLSAPGTTEDVYGDRKPKCESCMDELDRVRWAAEHGMPVPEPHDSGAHDG